ncbi:MAG: 30S ribosomal protein S1 [Bacteroidota bacterium]|nr:30S ribosomal protein S1 [Candidatus Kapabacteria bacterium]MDW8220542.1 30S ribosomal protein S1 [Bacteroidota bacterium]
MSEHVPTNPADEQMAIAAGKKPTALHKKYSVTSIMDDDFELEMMDSKELTSMFEKTLSTINENEIIKGRIVAINENEVAIDIGFKSEGIVPLSEFSNRDELKIGDEVEVFLENIEDSEGKMVLSRRRADFMRIWERINKAFETQEIVQAKILRRIKGGMVVDLMGIDAFLPGSQIDIKPVRDFDAWIGRTLDVRVVKINHPNENVVVSHKVLLEEQLAGVRQEVLERLEKGLVLEGHVKAIADFGVFIDLGGVDGLVHITDLSWGRVTHPSEIVQLDEKVKVVVLDFDSEKRRISLGMKQLTPHPWNTIGNKYEPGTRVQGKVVSLTDYGAFIEIEKGIEGLIHISEMSWTEHIKHPSQFVSMGQIVDAIVLNIDRESKKLSLGMKQLTPDPWQELLKKYPVGSQHRGAVRNITNFGVFVELEPGVDGLVHISDLSWTKKIRHPGEFVKKGEEIDVVILGIDLEQRRISLGHKQVRENPWDAFAEEYKVGVHTQGRIVRIIEKGVIVELPHGVDGFVPTSQLSFAPVKNIADYFRVDETLPLAVIEFDKDAKKIVLSAVEYLKTQDQATIDAYNVHHPVPGAENYVAELNASNLTEQPES